VLLFLAETLKGVQEMDSQELRAAQMPLKKQ
jgi:hypothetical protein